ncbi:MAG: hypothetical protein JWP91_1322 [Fibrobacteres bacterium]|nr:hypothetical protein [Fibrobacterota bacterium]
MAMAVLRVPTSAFVFLDTSEPGKTPARDSVSQGPESPSKTRTIPGSTLPSQPSAIVAPPVAAPAASSGPISDSAKPGQPAASPAKEPPRYGNVLFLSADSKLVYAYLGVWKALEEFGLAPDAMLVESKAAILGAAWALGYNAAQVEAEMLLNPLERFVRPDPSGRVRPGTSFNPEGPDPIQWNIPLDLQNLQAPGSVLSDVMAGEGREFLNLSWMIAKLTHDAPGGPVEDLSGTPRKLAVQVSDIATEQEKVVTEGALQSILKGSLLPAGVVRQRQGLWPYASGALLSGHSVMADKLPFDFDRIIVVQPGHRLRPPSLDRTSGAWTDSLNLRNMRRNSQSSSFTDGKDGAEARILRIELEPEGEFDPAETDPRRWISLGYTSTLRSMDVLKSILAKDSSRGGTGDGNGAVRDSGAPSSPANGGRLGLNRLSVNPLASGGRQLLLDILRISGNDGEDSAGNGAISALEKSGFYTGLDVEWAQGTGEENAVLVFDAQEKSKVEFRAGWNAAFTGEDVPDRAPEIYGGMSWSEPFYIPFQGEAGALLGGHRPGYEFRIQIAPVYPLQLQLGFSRTHWELLHAFSAPKAANQQGAIAIRAGRDLSEVYLKVYPMPSMYLRTAIQKHEMDFPGDSDPSERTFLSTDFQETAFLGAGRPDGAGIYPHSLRLRYKNLNRVNLFGPVKYSTSNFESRLRLSLGDFLFTDQFFWSDQSNSELTVFDLMEAGKIDLFSFQDEFFLANLYSANFQDAKIEYCPTFGKAGIRLIAGAYRNYQPALFGVQAEPHRAFGREIPFTPHWEAQAGYATPVGTLRIGMGAVEGGAPFYYLRMGAGLHLGFEDAQ